MANKKGKKGGKDNQWGDILQFNSKKTDKTETLELKIIAWNNETPSIPLDATLEIIELNATAFTLDSSASVQKTLRAGEVLTSIPDQHDKCGKGKKDKFACAEIK